MFFYLFIFIYLLFYLFIYVLYFLIQACNSESLISLSFPQCADASLPALTIRLPRVWKEPTEFPWNLVSADGPGLGRVPGMEHKASALRSSEHAVSSLASRLVLDVS